MGFPFLTIFMIFIIWLALRYQKLYRIQRESEESFWEAERTANSTPAKDIDNLSYLTIPLDKFPLDFSDEQEILDIENELKELAGHRLLNLTGKTNTELKTTYGVPNFETMSKIGEDFDRVTVLLNSYGKILVEKERIDDAIAVLEYAVGVKTDIAESYQLLIDCYKKNGNYTKLDYLKTQIEESNIFAKKKLLENFEILEEATAK